MNDDRTKGVHHIGDDLDELQMAMQLFLDSKTDEEWEEHDARVRRQLARERDAEAHKTRQSRIEVSGIRPRHEQHIAELQRNRELQVRDAMEALHKWMRSLTQRGARQLLVLGGPSSIGKTYAAVMWLLMGIDDPKPWANMFVTAPELQRMPMYGPGSHDWVLITRQAVNLVVDDLGAERDPSGEFAKRFDELVYERTERLKPTVVTTNLESVEAIDKLYGQRTVRRIMRYGTCWFSDKQPTLTLV